jgi:AraC-like DNA-binding protein
VPHQLKNSTMQILHGLDESIFLYKQTLSDLVAGGSLTADEAEKRLAHYQSSLVNVCKLVDDRPGHLGIDQSQYKELKEEFQRIEWRLQMHGEEQSVKNETDAIVAYLNFKRREIMQQLEKSLQVARSLFHSAGELRETKDTFIQMEAVEQVSRKVIRLRLPSWYWKQTPVHYDQRLVQEIHRQTGCQATIFQRIPEGFVRISTNFRKHNGQRAVGTFISNDSKVVKTILKGKTYRGSAFVLNNWYFSIYEPFYLDGELKGILYVGRNEALELTPAYSLSKEKVDQIFSRLKADGAFEMEAEEDITEKLVRVLSDLPQNAAHPVLQMGLKKVAALLIKGRENTENDQVGSDPKLSMDVITQYIRNHLTEDISIDFLAKEACMSKASLYRYFKTKFNTTPNMYIRQERLRFALQLMQDDNSCSVGDICQEVGFKNTSYFIKLFREQYGLTPKQYRKTQQASLSVSVNL